MLHLQQPDITLNHREIQLQDHVIGAGELTSKETQHVVDNNIAHLAVIETVGIITWAFAVSNQTAQLGDAYGTTRTLEH